MAFATRPATASSSDEFRPSCPAAGAAKDATENAAPQITVRNPGSRAHLLAAMHARLFARSRERSPEPCVVPRERFGESRAHVVRRRVTKQAACLAGARLRMPDVARTKAKIEGWGDGGDGIQ